MIPFTSIDSYEPLLTPGTVIPECRIDRPAALGTHFRERPDTPGPPNLPPAPRTIAHEAHEFAFAVPAPAVISHAGRSSFGGRGKPRAETPCAVAPLGQDAPVTARAEVAERRIRIEAVSLAAAPWADQHTLGDWLVAVDAPQRGGNHCPVPFDKRRAAHLLPVEHFLAGGFEGRRQLEALGNRLQ